MQDVPIATVVANPIAISSAEPVAARRASLELVAPPAPPRSHGRAICTAALMVAVATLAAVAAVGKGTSTSAVHLPDAVDPVTIGGQTHETCMEGKAAGLTCPEGLVDAVHSVEHDAAGQPVCLGETCTAADFADAQASCCDVDGPKCQFAGDAVELDADDVPTRAVVPSECQDEHQAVIDQDSCSTVDDSQAWNALIQCVFGPNNWMAWRYGGEGGCGGPTLFRFCQDAFPGDPDMIKCCSASRCPWSASPFGLGGGQPICIDDTYAVNICCLPCSCWLATDVSSDAGVQPGNSHMHIDETYTDHNGATYPVLMDNSNKPIAAPFPCGNVGMFNHGNVLSVADWQSAMGAGCSFDPMGGRRKLTSLRNDLYEPAWVKRPAVDE